MHAYVFIYSIQNNYTHIYYVNTNFYFGFWIAIYLCTVLVKICIFFMFYNCCEALNVVMKC